MSRDRAIDEDDGGAPPVRIAGWHVDRNVRLGDLLVIGTLLFGGIGAWYGLKGTIEQTAHDLGQYQAGQRERDAQQDASVARVEGYLKDSVQQIRNDQTDIRNDVRAIASAVRNRGG